MEETTLSDGSLDGYIEFDLSENSLPLSPLVLVLLAITRS